MADMIQARFLKSALSIALGVIALPLLADESREGRDRVIDHVTVMAERTPMQAFSAHPMQFFVLGADLGGSFYSQTNLDLVKDLSRSLSEQLDRPVWFFENKDGHSEGLLVTVLGSNSQLVSNFVSPENDSFWHSMNAVACDINAELLLTRGFESGHCFRTYDNMDTPENGVFTRAISAVTHSSEPRSSLIKQGIHVFSHADFVFGIVQFQHKIYTPPGKLTVEEFNKGDPFKDRRDFAVSVIRNSSY